MFKTLFFGTCVSVHGELKVSFKSRIGFCLGYRDEVDISKKILSYRQSFAVLIIQELLLLIHCVLERGTCLAEPSRQ